MKKALAILLTLLLGLLPVMSVASGSSDSSNDVVDFFLKWQPELDYPIPEGISDLASSYITVVTGMLAQCTSMLREALLSSDFHSLSSLELDEENFNSMIQLCLVSDPEEQKKLCENNETALYCLNKLGFAASKLNLAIAEKNVVLAANKYAKDDAWFGKMLNNVIFAQLMLAQRLYLPENEASYSLLLTLTEK